MPSDKFLEGLRAGFWSGFARGAVMHLFILGALMCLILGAIGGLTGRKVRKLKTNESGIY